jgi:cellulose synthase/poly-beta-1,6-N-acetylglucosamine synthase-like glycosyltransferase
MEIALLVLYFAVLLALCTYGVHRAHLAYLCFRHQRRIERASRPVAGNLEKLPAVTVQLPLYNEATVASRLIEAVGGLDYPAELLEIQVLDDSSDETRTIARAAVDALRARGINAVYIRRPSRVGYKAGALDYGLKTARGDLVAIFDADFIPQPSFLQQVVGHFDDPSIGMVQTRWAHLNRDASLLTSIQALMLDGHHLVENRARFGAGYLFNFSGTGGIWRRKAIDDAGGWQHDTLTEDLDLSYRAQLHGWRFVYRPDVITPAELPEDLAAFRAQQYRWAKGTVQTARKLLSRVLNEPLSRAQKIEACFHLLPHFAYPLMLLLSILLLPALILMPATDTVTMLFIDLPLCLGATGSLATFYAVAERAQGRSAWCALRRLPALIALGAGLAPFLTRAVIDGLSNMAGEFVRTPKRGSSGNRYRQVIDLPFVELSLMLLSAVSVLVSMQTGHWFATPFALLFTFGYGFVSTRLVVESIGRRHLRVADVVAPAPESRPVEGATDVARAA